MISSMALIAKGCVSGSHMTRLIRLPSKAPGRSCARARPPPEAKASDMTAQASRLLFAWRRRTVLIVSAEAYPGSFQRSQKEFHLRTDARALAIRFVPLIFKLRIGFV